jgi:competence protein ComEA
MGRVLVNRRPTPPPPRKNSASYVTNPTFDSDSTDSYGMERRARVRPRRPSYYDHDPIDSRVWDRRDGPRIYYKEPKYTDSDSYGTLSYESYAREERKGLAPVRRYPDEHDYDYDYDSCDSRSARESIDRREFQTGQEGPHAREYRMSDYEFEDNSSKDESTLRSDYTSESRSTLDSAFGRDRIRKQMLPPRRREAGVPPVSSPEGPPVREYHMRDYEFEDSSSKDESTLRSDYTSDSRSTLDSSLGRSWIEKQMQPPRRTGPGLPPLSSSHDTFSDRSSRYSGSGRQKSSRLSVVSEDESAKLAAESVVDHLKKNRGYYLKKDGTILSSGSSMTTDRGTNERYIDPETAAKSVIESLESMGYSYDVNDGVKEKESGSTNESSERYRMGRAFSEDTRSGAGSGSTRKTKESKGTKGTTGTKESKSTKESSAKESKAKDSKNTTESTRTKESKTKDSKSIKESESTKGSSAKDSKAKDSKSTKESKSTKGSSAKDSKTKDSKSTKESGPKETNLATVGSKVLDLFTKIASGSESESFSDESTISTKDTKFGGILKRPNAAVSEVPCGDMSKVEDTAQTVEKKVEWAGEMPPPTSSGARVPELVKSFPEGLVANLSDLTSIQHTLDSASYPDITNLTEDRIERFFEQFFLSCRLALHQPKA